MAKKIISNTPSLRGTTTYTVDGISYRVTRGENGSIVDSPCGCFGLRTRCHSSRVCPWQKKRALEESKKPKATKWNRIEADLCDLCTKVAVWKHPAGGFRCTKCHRPEK